jgi:hypothetical protein
VLHPSKLGKSEVANADSAGWKAEDLAAITHTTPLPAQASVGRKYDYRGGVQGDLSR